MKELDLEEKAPWEADKSYTQYTLMFIYACVIYSFIGFTWGAVMGGVEHFRHFVDHRMYGNLLVRAHAHINLLGWVECAIFGAIYYLLPRLVKKPIYSMKLVKAHFWLHNFGLIGMVVFFSTAGVIGGEASLLVSPQELDALVRPWLALVGIFGSIVLLANVIWGYNIFRTASGWRKTA